MVLTHSHIAALRPRVSLCQRETETYNCKRIVGSLHYNTPAVCRPSGCETKKKAGRQRAFNRQRDSVWLSCRAVSGHNGQQSAILSCSLEIRRQKDRKRENWLVNVVLTPTHEVSLTFQMP